jgi:hypothetical protein
MIFQGEMVRLYKRDGKTVCGYGVEWTEARQLQEKLLFASAILFFFVGLYISVFALGSIDIPGSRMWVVLTAMAIASFTAFWKLRRLSAHLPGKPKVIEFYHDGRIWDSRDGEWGMRIDNIRNIGAVELKPKRKPEDSNYTHGVRLITRRGRIIRIAQDLEPDDSVTLAVLLNEAIDRVRYVAQGESRPALDGADVW